MWDWWAALSRLTGSNDDITFHFQKVLKSFSLPNDTFPLSMFFTLDEDTRRAEALKMGMVILAGTGFHSTLFFI